MIPAMKTSKYGVKFIERWEWKPQSKVCGWNGAKQLYFPYPDYKGYMTMGCGHLIKAGENFSAGLNEDEVATLLGTDLGKCERALARFLTRIPLQNQFDAFVCFLFNVGEGNADPARCSVMRAFNAGQFDDVPKFLELYDHSGGAVDKGLLNRRKDEGKLFMTPYPDEVMNEVSEEALKAYSLIFDPRGLINYDDDFHGHSDPSESNS